MIEKISIRKINSNFLGEISVEELEDLKAFAKRKINAILYKIKKLGQKVEEIDSICDSICENFGDCYNCPISLNCQKKEELDRDCIKSKAEIHAKVGVCRFCPRLRLCLSDKKLKLTINEEFFKY
jgi:hypothetical protein